jgi:hypothetical protein
MKIVSLVYCTSQQITLIENYDLEYKPRSALWNVNGEKKSKLRGDFKF